MTADKNRCYLYKVPKVNTDRKSFRLIKADRMLKEVTERYSQSITHSLINYIVSQSVTMLNYSQSITILGNFDEYA